MNHSPIAFIKTGVVILLLLMFATQSESPLFGKEQYINAIKPGMDIYYGHISFIDNPDSPPMIYKEGRTEPETGVLNFPITPGSTIRTGNNGRCEIQFDTGAVLRLDSNSEVTLETVLAQSLSSRKKLTNLALNQGSAYLMYKSYMIRELFQVMTANAALEMSHNSVAMLSVDKDSGTDIEMKEGKAFLLYGPDENHLLQEKIKKPQVINVSSADQIEYYETSRDNDFESWNLSVNQDFEALHEGKSILPKPIYRYPEAVIYFAMKYSTTWGEWLYDDLYGYVWHPYLNRLYPSGWQPYSYGQWTAANGQMFWIPEEPWGWAPYHLGNWMWDENKGWLWIPGAAFAPAWVVWQYYTQPAMGSGFFAWRPWTILDWTDWSYNRPFWIPGQENPREYMYDTEESESWNKKGNAYYTLKGPIKKIFKNTLKAAKQGDKRVISSYAHIIGSRSAVKHEDLSSPNIHNRLINLESFGQRTERAFPELNQKDMQPKIIGSYFVTKFANPMENENNPEARIRFNPDVLSIGGASAREVPAAPSAGQADHQLRFRDWNPDIQAARSLGVSIHYSGARNEITCPELRISSNNVRVTRGTRGNGFHASIRGGGDSGPVSSSNLSASSSSSASSAARSSTGTATRTSGGSSKTKKK